MNENLDIFICTHRDFTGQPTNPCYKIISGPNTNITSNLEIFIDKDTEITPKEFSYAEGSRIYWIWKNFPLKEYIGICHYRSYFSFFDDIPNMDEIFSKYKIVTTEPLNFSYSIKQQYYKHHIPFDFGILSEIVGENFRKEFEKTKLFSRNMFIMKKEDFLEYCEFAFGSLKKFDEKLNLKTDEDVQKLHNTNRYQSRIEGFLLERLTSAFITYKFKPEEIKTYPLNFTETRTW